MDFQTFKARLALNCGNLPSSHPLYTYLGAITNDAIRFMAARAMSKYPNSQLFPEYRDIDDISVVTTNGANAYTIPTQFLVVERVFSADSSSAPTDANTNWRPVWYMDPNAFDQLNKPTTQLQYPANYTFKANVTTGNNSFTDAKLYVWPTPRTGNLTYLKLSGIAGENDLVDATDVPYAHARWHPAILDYASHLMWNDLGSPDDAARYLASGDMKLQTAADGLIGMRRYQLKKRVRVAGFNF